MQRIRMSVLHRISGCNSAARAADVLFIHGLGGDAFATWGAGQDALRSWPCWLGEEFPSVGVWSLGYAASPTKWLRLLAPFSKRWRDLGHSAALPDRGLQTLDLMVQQGFGGRPILFVCHSLGGLLAKQILRKAADATELRKRAVFSQTRAVLFLATPHDGADLATLVDSFRTVLGTTVSLEELRAHDAHLRDLYNWYRNQSAVMGIHTASYFEVRSVKGVTIVDPTSAHPGVGADPIGLDEDHISIAKPAARDAQVCGALRDLLRNHVLDSCSRIVVQAESTPITRASSPQVVTKSEGAALLRTESATHQDDELASLKTQLSRIRDLRLEKLIDEEIAQEYQRRLLDGLVKPEK
jgi:hypothetical protein